MTTATASQGTVSRKQVMAAGETAGVTTSAPDASVQDAFVERDGLRMVQIKSFDQMPPFLVNVVGDGDVWTYVSTAGALTAGRVEPRRCLFPYVTDDVLHRSGDNTGPRTAMRIKREGEPSLLWRPFVGRSSPQVERNLYKPIEGTQLIFEEVRRDLGLTFCYRWAPTGAFGLVRTAWLTAHEDAGPASVALIDGLLNLVPAGIVLPTLQGAGCLINAYTQAEVDASTGLVTIGLTSRISDTADPHESLTANTAWSCGLEDAAVGLTSAAFEAFEAERSAVADTVERNLRVDYSLRSSFDLAAGETKRWDIALDADRSQSQAVALRKRLRESTSAELAEAIDTQIESARQGLTAIVAASDGMQCTADEKATAHHFSSTMFNSMRGGTVADGYVVDVADFLDFVAVRNRTALSTIESAVAGEKSLNIDALRNRLAATGDADAVRLGLEYLPLSFGRRHGDPSRPWNMFAIHVAHPDGRRILDYQGNWRDIFQNWEALACSFPRLIDGMVAKFLNATTADGFNPYRISRAGIDWERPDPEDPWANIGYWGDHQLVYLLRLLELAEAHEPGEMAERLNERVFSYANVPYRLKSYEQIAADPKHSIEFEQALDREIDGRVERMGTDGRLRLDDDGRVVHVSLAEKLLVPMLSKACNLVPGGGVWMNTQRPEWNDANNALAGFGLSVVTTCYLRRYAVFVRGLVEANAGSTLKLSGAVAAWLTEASNILGQAVIELDAGEIDDARREQIVRQLGHAFERYGRSVYDGELGDLAEIDTGEVLELLDRTCRAAEQTIARNQRPDGLYHSYNLIDLREPGKASIKHLDVMLEGQVAVLSSGMLDASEAKRVLTAMFDSALYRPDVASFTLYPRRDRPSFFEHNVLNEAAVHGIDLLQELRRRNDPSIVELDADGDLRFNAAFSNDSDLSAALETLKADESLTDLVKSDRAAVLRLFDETFDHHAFTGRSGTMYGYEGLGCVYWHMVAKLQLAAQECWLAARKAGADADQQASLRELYGRVRDGLGFRKDADTYGAFPTDAYSHTPGNRGAQQPGMTGQVKEEMLTRRAEMGVSVEDGCLRLDAAVVAESEFLVDPTEFVYLDLEGAPRARSVPSGAIALTVCQVPVVIHRVEENVGSRRIEIEYADGTSGQVDGDTLDAQQSAKVFGRTGEIVALRSV
ncbi:MAG: hypothetical protein AAGF84_03635 [Planctomycetota bacterium]